MALPRLARLVAAGAHGHAAWRTRWRAARGSSDAAVGDPGCFPFKRVMNPTLLVHFGNVVMLAGLSQTDMLSLRSMLVVGSLCGITYNLLQPRPLVAPALWGCAFLSLHFYMIAVLLRERQELKLEADEDEVYKYAFQPYGFTRQQFMDILECAAPRWCSWPSGAYVHSKGDDMAEMHYVFEGEVEVLSATDDRLHKVYPGKGGWLGEFFDPNQPADYWGTPHRWCYSARCVSEQCRTMGLPRRLLHETLMGNPRLKEAAIRATLSDVWGKLHLTVRDMRRDAYKSMLKVALIDGVLDSAEQTMLEQFRQRHKISDDEHRMYLEDLGWSVDALNSRRAAQRRCSYTLA